MEAQLPRFHVFDGAVRIVIEAHSEDDALGLCIKWVGKLFAPVKTNE